MLMLVIRKYYIMSFLTETNEAMSHANDFVAWMKLNKSDSHHFYSESQSMNQIPPYVTYSTLVFAYEWKQNDDTEGNIFRFTLHEMLMKINNLHLHHLQRYFLFIQK